MRVKPMTVSRSVVLPTPFRPSTARLPCSAISSETSSSTTAEPYPARTSSSTSSGSAMAPAPEIDFAHARVGGNLGGRAFEQDAPADHHDNPAGETKHDVHIVLDEQYRDLLRQVGDRREQLRALILGHAGRGLVEQQHLRPGRERQGDLDEALLAVSQFMGRSMAALAHVERSQDAVGLIDRL